MNIADVSEYVWGCSIPIPFGNSHEWDDDLFTVKWAKSNSLEKQWARFGQGWYWFSVKETYQALHDVIRPSTLPKGGCDIGKQTHENRDTFGVDCLCAHDDGWVVIYNGHEKNIASRVRSHFSLKNDKTGAIGLKHYPLSASEWRVNLFSVECFSKEVAESDKSRIQALMNSPTGRCAVESAWRVKYGWPVLCKE